MVTAIFDMTLDNIDDAMEDAAVSVAVEEDAVVEDAAVDTVAAEDCDTKGGGGTGGIRLFELLPPFC